jgi:hypothetical protein
MAFVRSRYGEGDNDFTRAARQQLVLTAIARKLTAGNLLLALPGLLDAVRQNLATDIPADRFAAIATEVESANLAGLERVVLTPDDGFVLVETDSAAGYILHPDFDAIRAMAHRIFGTSTGRLP